MCNVTYFIRKKYVTLSIYTPIKKKASPHSHPSRPHILIHILRRVVRPYTYTYTRLVIRPAPYPHKKPPAYFSVVY
jgi:hypothetical protein